MKEKAMNPVLWISVFVVVLSAGPSVTRAQTGAEADVVTTISNLENDGVKADLAGDPAFYHKVLAEDWTRGDSDGTYYTKAELLRLMADTKNFKTNSEKLSELKVRVYGDTAVATYKDTYDILIMGEHPRTPSSPRTLSPRWATNGSRSRVTGQRRSSRFP
jgi:hypothetical protein